MSYSIRLFRSLKNSSPQITAIDKQLHNNANLTAAISTIRNNSLVNPAYSTPVTPLSLSTIYSLSQQQQQQQQYELATIQHPSSKGHYCSECGYDCDK
jgi:hypothetical protein